jgi:hypothetical protein
LKEIVRDKLEQSFNEVEKLFGASSYTGWGALTGEEAIFYCNYTGASGMWPTQ